MNYLIHLLLWSNFFHRWNRERMLSCDDNSLHIHDKKRKSASDNVPHYFRDSPLGQMTNLRQYNSSYLSSRSLDEFRFNSDAIQQFCGLLSSPIRHWASNLGKLRLIRSRTRSSRRRRARTSLRKRTRYTTSWGTPAETVRKVGRRRIRARKRERRAESRRRRFNAWRTLVVRVARVRTWLVLLVLSRPFVHPRPYRARAAPAVDYRQKGSMRLDGAWTGCGKKDAKPRRIPSDPPTEPANRSPAMKRNTRRTHVPSTDSQQNWKFT